VNSVTIVAMSGGATTDRPSDPHRVLPDPWHVRDLVTRSVMLALDATTSVGDAVAELVRRGGADLGLLGAVADEVRERARHQPGEAADRAVAITRAAVDTAASVARWDDPSRGGLAVAS
jgi:hypothetical protein